MKPRNNQGKRGGRALRPPRKRGVHGQEKEHVEQGAEADPAKTEDRRRGASHGTQRGGTPQDGRRPNSQGQGQAEAADQTAPLGQAKDVGRDRVVAKIDSGRVTKNRGLQKTRELAASGAQGGVQATGPAPRRVPFEPELRPNPTRQNDATKDAKNGHHARPFPQARRFGAGRNAGADTRGRQISAGTNEPDAHAAVDRHPLRRRQFA